MSSREARAFAAEVVLSSSPLPSALPRQKRRLLCGCIVSVVARLLQGEFAVHMVLSFIVSILWIFAFGHISRNPAIV